MSFSTEEDVDCPCGEIFTASLWSSVNLKEDPGLRGVLLGGELNVVSCPICRSLVYAERFLLVHDPASELLAFVHPKSRETERPLLEESMGRHMAEARGAEGGLKISYPPELIFGLESLVDLLRREEESADQSAVLDALSFGGKVAKIPPAKARATGLPRSVPLGTGATPVERLAAGLRAALAANDRLTLYAELLKKVSDGNLPAAAEPLL